MRVELTAGVALAAVLLLTALLRRYGRVPGWPLLLLVVALVLGATRVWSRGSTEKDPDRLVRADLVRGEGNKTLIVLVHGLGGPTALDEVRADLGGLGAVDWSLLDAPPAGGRPRTPDVGAADLLVVDYGNTFRVLPSNSRAAAVARGVSRQIQKAVDAGSYDRVVVVGYSMGATVARAAFLDASDKAVGAGGTEPKDWAKKVCRFVLLAGMNRGWDFSGLKPSDMDGVKYGVFRAGANAGRWTGTGHLYLDTEAGSAFVAGVRLEWMNLARERGAGMPGTVQLLGDIDDFVTDADNKDLRVAGASQFAWLRVRGTGHAEIVDLGRCAPAGSDDRRLGEYRARKIRQAVTRPFAELQAAAEEQPYQEDRDVKHVVFVVHGIRDLGQWSSGFEESLQAAFRRRQVAAAAATQVGLAAAVPVSGPTAGPGTAGGGGAPHKLVVATPRYGYLPMGPFLLHPVRQKYVRGFMDAYTETRARYPAAATVDAIGHSNGTYLITGALKDYPALKLDRVVLGNSVVGRAYPWHEQRVTAVRNYVTSDDWVVALFPRFFEVFPGSILDNDIGGSGFTGFDDDAGGAVTNVAPVHGGHSALHEEAAARRADIVAFLLEGKSVTSEEPQKRYGWFDWLSACCWVVWAIIAYLLAVGGYACVLVSAGSWLRLTGKPWAWLAGPGWWWTGTLRLLGAFLCFLAIAAYFYTAREALLFVLVVALAAGFVLRRWFPTTAIPPLAAPKELEVLPVVLAVGLGVSFLAGGLGGLAEVGWLVLAALIVVPVAVVLGLVVALVPPAARGGKLERAARVAAAAIAVFLLVADWWQFFGLVGVFLLGQLLGRLAGGPLNDAAVRLPAGLKPRTHWSDLGYAAGLLVAPAYFIAAGYFLLRY